MIYSVYDISKQSDVRYWRLLYEISRFVFHDNLPLKNVLFDMPRFVNLLCNAIVLFTQLTPAYRREPLRSLFIRVIDRKCSGQKQGNQTTPETTRIPCIFLPLLLTLLNTMPPFT